MTSDHDVERKVEDWLEAEARPMPLDVLEGALEAVSRTSQVGARRVGPAWLRSRPSGWLAAAAVLILIVVVGGLAVDRIGSVLPTESASARPPQTWDPVADFRHAPNQLNPSPDAGGHPNVWGYLRSATTRHDPASYELLPHFEGEHAWNQPGMTNLPSFLREAWNEPALTNVFVGLGAIDGLVYLHPTTSVHAVLAWTSPVDGEVTIAGTVARPQDPCAEPSGGLVISVDRNSETLRSIGLDLGQRVDFTIDTVVEIGESIYVVVDSGTDAICDLTSLRLTIVEK